MLRFLLDEHVPHWVESLLGDRDHDVFRVRDRLPLGASDQRIVSEANQLSAVIVTWNRKHFQGLVSREPRRRLISNPNAGFAHFQLPTKASGTSAPAVHRAHRV